MRIVEASCIVGAAVMINASVAIRSAVCAIATGSLLLELMTAKDSTHPFRPNNGRGIVVALAILPLVFASQLALQGFADHGLIPFLLKLSMVSAILFLLQLQRRSDFHFTQDKLTTGAVIIVAFLVFSYADFLKGIALVFMHVFFVRSLIFRLPFTFTFGEAYVIAFFMSLVMYNGIARLIASVLFFLPSWSLLSPVVALDHPWAVIAQYILLALAMAVIATSSLIPDLKSSSRDFDERNLSEFWARFLIIGLIVDVVLVFGLDHEPIFFVLKSMFEQPVRLALCLGWLISITVSLLIFKRTESWLQCRIILSRKLYHCLITFIVVPGILIDFYFLALAFVVAFSVFVVCELIRVARVSEISTILQQYMSAYVNASKEPALAGRDCGPVILAHIYLLIGCAFPVWLHLPFVNSNNPLSLLPAFAGAVALGVCDSAAAYVGVRFGTLRWPGSKRTFQGSIAAFASAFLALALLNMWVCNNVVPIKSFLLPALGLSIMETCLDQVDNLFLPLFFYSSLNIISR